MPRRTTDSGTETTVRDRVKVQLPRLFRVLLLNDDYTTMDFVVSILEQIFRKSPAEAVQIMLHVHQRGQGVCGTYPKQIAEAKVEQVHRHANAAGYPLKCTMEPE